MLIRDATTADIPEIAELERLCFSTPWPEELISIYLSGPGRVLIAAEEQGAAVGYMGLQYVLDEGYITNVCTSPEYRRRGIGLALIDEMILRANELSLSFLTLEVRETNSPAQKLYALKGFSQVGRRPKYYEHPDEDAILMTLYLKEA